MPVTDVSIRKSGLKCELHKLFHMDEIFGNCDQDLQCTKIRYCLTRPYHYSSKVL